MMTKLGAEPAESRWHPKPLAPRSPDDPIRKMTKEQLIEHCFHLRDVIWSNDAHRGSLARKLVRAQNKVKRLEQAVSEKLAREDVVDLVERTLDAVYGVVKCPYAEAHYDFREGARNAWGKAAAMLEQFRRPTAAEHPE